MEEAKIKKVRNVIFGRNTTILIFKDMDKILFQIKKKFKKSTVICSPVYVLWKCIYIPQVRNLTPTLFCFIREKKQFQNYIQRYTLMSVALNENTFSFLFLK